MAGLGAKLFTAFSKLTAAQVNGYLMDQTIMRFASTAARDAAFGGAGEPTLAEGMTCYLDDTNQIQSYNGSAWVTLTSSINPPALDFISSVTCSSGGTASNGVVTIGSGVSSVVVGNAFSSAYDNYKIIISGGTNSVGTDASFQFTGITTGYQTVGYFMTPGISTVNGYGPPGIAVQWLVGSINSTRYTTSFDVISPFLTQQKFMLNMAGISTTGYYNFSGLCTSTSSATGFSYISNTPSFTGGTIRVYGYRNQL